MNKRKKVFSKMMTKRFRASPFENGDTLNHGMILRGFNNQRSVSSWYSR